MSTTQSPPSPLSPPLHVVYGAGQVGQGLARALLARGLRVRVVRRSDGPVPDGAERVQADMRDPAQARSSAEGAAVLYHCMNPSAYTKTAWQAEFPVMGEALIAAAVHHGARLVCLDNLYGYGPVDGARTEQTPMSATGPKGRVRVQWDARLREAAAAQGLRWTAGRAGDFFGPGTGDHSMLAPKLLADDNGPWLLADVQAPHAFSYVPDVVAGLAALGTAGAEVEGRAWHLPVMTLAPADLVARIAAARGRPARSRRLPGWQRALLSPFLPLMRELGETWYQWDRPFQVDDGAFRARFPEVGATVAEAVATTAAEVDATAAA